MELPGDEVKDAADRVAAGGTKELLLELVDAALEWKSAAPSEPEEAADDGLPRIVVTGRHLRDTVAEAWEVLVEFNEPPTIFRRGGLFTEVI